MPESLEYSSIDSDEWLFGNVDEDAYVKHTKRESNLNSTNCFSTNERLKDKWQAR